MSAADIFLPERYDTVLAAVAADLLVDRRPTGKSCWFEHGSSRLAHHIYALRQSGWPVMSREVEVNTSDGRRQAIAEYSLPAEFIAQLGERGTRFVEAVRESRAARKVAA